MAIFLIMALLGCGEAGPAAPGMDAGAAADAGVDDGPDAMLRSCEAVTAEIEFEVRASVACANADDCTAWAAPMCDGPAACWNPVSTERVSRLDRLARERARACARAECDCPDAPTPACVSGRCEFETGNSCPYECDRPCPCDVGADGCAMDACRPGTCVGPADCEELERPDCEGAWACDAGSCNFVCAAPECPYVCDLECRCAVDERGCDQPECDLSCTEPSICEGLPHAPCEGAWTCDESTCVWRCEDNVCGTIADDLEAARAEISRCEDGDICKSADNQLCGNVGGCYTFYREDADFEQVRELERAYREARCFRPFCDHCPPPPPAECRDRRCQATD